VADVWRVAKGCFVSNLPVSRENGKLRDRRDFATRLGLGEGRLSTCAVTRRRFSSGCKPRSLTYILCPGAASNMRGWQVLVAGLAPSVSKYKHGAGPGMLNR
jgi:hypothetical protein